MPFVSIGNLVPGLTTGYLKAIVMIKWPYRASLRDMAVVLAEPDLKLRRADGQVKVCFSDACALSLSTASITIGDEVLLSLQGVEIKKAVKLNRGIDLEMHYVDRLSIQVLRNGVRVFNHKTAGDIDLAALDS
jgi:hypothetical protein